MTTRSVLGLNIGLHDSSATALSFEDERLNSAWVFASERVTRKKHQGLFPYLALKKLRSSHPEAWQSLESHSVAVNAFGPDPRDFETEIERIFPQHEELLAAYDLGISSFGKNPQVQAVTHHLCHAYSCLVTRPFQKALIVVADGMGNQPRAFGDNHLERSLVPMAKVSEFEYFSVYAFDGTKLLPLKKSFTPLDPIGSLRLSRSPGILFENASKILFGDWSHAGKVMGLSAYGRPGHFPDPETLNCWLSKTDIVSTPNKTAFDALTDIEFQRRADMAASVQQCFEEVMLQELKLLRNEFPEYDHLILTGGCALNCLFNDRLRREKIFQNVYIPPWPNDEGISIGAALCLAHKNKLWTPESSPCGFSEAFLGASVDKENIERLFHRHKIYPLPEMEKIAQLLTEGEPIAWMRGRAEVGPRALGNRSIFARPDLPGMKKRFNAAIKFREHFRPYGVSLLEKEGPKYLQVADGYTSPYMTFAPRVRDEYKHLFSEVIQPDGSCRIQTVSPGAAPELETLLHEVGKRTNLAALLHTSLNVMGEPLCETTEDALRFFEGSDVNYLVIEDYLIKKVR